MRSIISTILISCFLLSSAFAADATHNVARVYFKNLKDGEIVTSPLKVEMGVEGMEIAPAGEVKAGQGHHHIIVDGGPIAKGTVVPADATHLHFGKGQTETSLELTPGKHTLTLQLADGLHQSYGEELSATLHVVVR